MMLFKPWSSQNTSPGTDTRRGREEECSSLPGQTSFILCALIRPDLSHEATSLNFPS